MRLKKYDIKKLNYNIMIVVLHFAVFIQVLSILIFPTVSAANIECDDYNCVGTIEDDYIESFFVDTDNDNKGLVQLPSTHGEGGNDEIYGTYYKEYLDGNNGDDQIYGKQGNDAIFGGYGDDEIYGDEGDDALRGDAGSDTIYGGKGNDKITGSDVYNGDPDYSKDTIICGLGYDTVYINVSEDGDEAADDCENVITE